jgi:hypothetical protein
MLRRTPRRSSFYRVTSRRKKIMFDMRTGKFAYAVFAYIPQRLVQIERHWPVLATVLDFTGGIG